MDKEQLKEELKEKKQQVEEQLRNGSKRYVKRCLKRTSLEVVPPGSLEDLADGDAERPQKSV